MPSVEQRCHQLAGARSSFDRDLGAPASTAAARTARAISTTTGATSHARVRIDEVAIRPGHRSERRGGIARERRVGSGMRTSSVPFPAVRQRHPTRP
jgi:hypothetical protein